jgi:uncharacterized protein YuzE
MENKNEKQHEDKKDLPRVVGYKYDKDGKICGVSILADEGQLPEDSVEKYHEWCRQKRLEQK